MPDVRNEETLMMIQKREHEAVRRGHSLEINCNAIQWVSMQNKIAIAMLRRVNIIIINKQMPLSPVQGMEGSTLEQEGSPDVAPQPEATTPGTETQYETEDRRPTSNTMILNEKIYMHQMKMRDIYLIDATEEKIKIMPMEQVKFYRLQEIQLNLSK